MEFNDIYDSQRPPDRPPAPPGNALAQGRIRFGGMRLGI